MIATPPRLVERLLAWSMRDPSWRESVLGDLSEEFSTMTTQAGARSARSWYRKQAFGIAARRFAARLTGRPLVPDRLPEPTEPRDGLSGALWHDLRHAWRVVRHQPALSLTVVLVLAVAIAANGTVFSVADALVLRPFRYPGVDRAVVLASDGHTRFFARQSVTPGDFMDWREQAGDAFSRLAALEWWDPAYSHDGPPQQLAGFRVTASLFDILGVRAELGRTLLESDAAGDAAVAVLSHDFWVRQFGSRLDVLGKTIWLDTKPHRVVGVMPPTFTVPFGAEVWAPLAFTPEARSDRKDQHLMVVAQLAPGVSAEASEQRLLAILAQQKKAYPETHARREVSVRTFTEGFGDQGSGPFIAVWQVASLLLLLVACANVANLLLARNTERQRELAVRMALGASARRIAWQLLLESLVLAAAASLLSLPLIWAGLRAIRVSMPDAVIRFVQGINYMEVQPATFLATTLLAVCATVIAAMIPALRASRGSVVESLRPGTRVSDGASRQRGRAVLATAQIALTLALLATAGLSLSALYRVSSGPIGFDTVGILTGSISLPDTRYAELEKRRQFIDAVLRPLSALPSVVDAAVISSLPYSGSYSYVHFWPEGVGLRESTAVDVVQQAVTPTALTLLKVPLLDGRMLAAADREESPPVALVNRALAEKMWKSTNVVGRRFYLRPDAPPVTVVGVVGDVAQDWIVVTRTLNVYLPVAQHPPGSFAVMLRTVPDPNQLAANLRAVVQSADVDQPVLNVRTMEKVVEDKTVGLRFAANTLAIIAAVSCLLSSVGLYSMMSFLMSRRTREIGVRVALGATRWDIVRLTGTTAVKLTAAGIIVGLVLAYAAGRLMEQAMFGVVNPSLTLAIGLAVVLALVSLAASYIPAQRAATVDPTTALRAE